MIKLVIVDEQQTDTREGRKSARGEEKDHHKVIYIAGPIKGHENYRNRFWHARKYLEGRGWIVLNPSVLPWGMPEDKYMPICLAMLEQADAIYMLEGWEDSSGATIEYLTAAYQGKQILLEGV